MITSSTEQYTFMIVSVIVSEWQGQSFSRKIKLAVISSCIIFLLRRVEIVIITYYMDLFKVAN